MAYFGGYLNNILLDEIWWIFAGKKHHQNRGGSTSKGGCSKLQRIIATGGVGIDVLQQFSSTFQTSLHYESIGLHRWSCPTIKPVQNDLLFSSR